MYISYSGYEKYGTCRKAYYLNYIAKVPGPPENRVNMLYGDAVGKIFERFYVDEIWKSNMTPRLLALVRPTLERIIEHETRRGGVFNWDDPDLKEGTRSLAQVTAEVEATIPRGLASIRHHQLVGRDAQAEVVLDTTVENHRIGGRADFVMTRVKTGDLVIVDGKGSRYRDQYSNHRQLRWYAMLYGMKHGVIPNRLGFLYWRSEPAESMDWSTVADAELRDLKAAVLSTIDEIERDAKAVESGVKPFQLFVPNPGSECKFCKFRPMCREGQTVLSEEYRLRRTADRESGVEEGDVAF